MGGGGELFQIPSKHQLVLILHAIITWISHEVHAHTRTKVQFPWKTTSCVRRCVNYFWNFIPFSLMFFKISLNNFLNWDVNGMYWFNLWCWFMMMAGCKSVKKLRNFPHWHCFHILSFCTLNGLWSQTRYICGHFCTVCIPPDEIPYKKCHHPCSLRKIEDFYHWAWAHRLFMFKCAPPLVWSTARGLMSVTWEVT